MAPRKKVIPSAFGGTDLQHVGQLYRRIREARGLPIKTVAKATRTSSAAISRFERVGDIDTTSDTATKAKRTNSFESLVDVLCMTEIDGWPIDNPLEPKYAKLLKQIYEESNTVGKVNRRQEAFSYITYETVKEASSSNHLSPLWQLKQKLSNETRPAFIADPLWFIHAINGACFNLFGITTPDPHNTNRPDHYLDRWEAWHVMGAKFTRNSPVRDAHETYNDYFPPTVDLFFGNLSAFLFTVQTRALIHRLISMSRENRFKFPSWWRNATCMTMDYDPELLHRRIRFKDVTRPKSPSVIIHAAANQVEIHEVPLTPDGVISVPFWIGIWNGDTKESRTLVENLPGPTPNTDIFYAADFDRNGDFHVNNWPEVEHLLTTS